jgi:hypothetical protein
LWEQEEELGVLELISVLNTSQLNSRQRFLFEKNSHSLSFLSSLHCAVPVSFFIFHIMYKFNNTNNGEGDEVRIKKKEN